MEEFIDVMAAGMFTPQEKGACKLTLIIAEADTQAQNFAFEHLRYQKVRIGLVPAETGESPIELTHGMGAAMVRRGLEIMERCQAEESNHSEPTQEPGLFEDPEETTA